MKFINRFSELKRLTRHPGEDTAIIYGRRRVGKTALIRKAVENTPHLFYQAVKLPAALIYKELAMEIGGQTGNRALQSGEIKDISTILEIFAETSKGWTLYVLREELRETRTYMAVLQAIASGRHRFSEIADVSSIPVSSLPKYLDVLKGINLVQQEIPVNEKPTSKKGLWRISDHMIRFWFKFVLPYRHMIEIEAGEKAIPLVREKWNDYMGDIYENIALQLVWEMIKQDELPFVEKLGRWWNKEMEFDILGMNGKKVYLVGEVKWGHFSASDLDKFLQKVKRLPFDLAENVTYVLFSGKGFQVEIPSGIIAVTGDKKHLVSTPHIRK